MIPQLHMDSAPAGLQREFPSRARTAAGPTGTSREWTEPPAAQTASAQLLRRIRSAATAAAARSTAAMLPSSCQRKCQNTGAARRAIATLAISSIQKLLYPSATSRRTVPTMTMPHIQSSSFAVRSSVGAVLNRAWYGSVGGVGQHAPNIAVQICESLRPSTAQSVLHAA